MHKPTVLIERYPWTKMFGWCRAATSEVSGYGLCYYDNGVFRVYDAFLPKQYCSSGYTEVDDKANILLQKKLNRWGRNMEHYRLWWHTHYNFSVFWSGTDDRNAEEQVRVNGDWNLSLVINQKGDYRCRVDSIRKFSNTIDKIDNIDCYLVQNSKRHDRKRNFKGDINRWVRPMTDMPTIQNNKGLVRTSEDLKTEPAYQGHTPVDSRWTGQWKREESYPTYGDTKGWQDYWEKRQNNYKITEPNPDDPPDLIILPEEKTEEQAKEQPEEKKEEKHTAGITATFGSRKYVLYDGRWVNKVLFEQLINCHCLDGNCMNCIDLKAAEVEENEREIQKSETPD